MKVRMIRRTREIAVATMTLAAILVFIAPSSGKADEPRFLRSSGERMMERDFTVKPGGLLVIDVDGMDVYVKESTGNVVHVEAYVAGPNSEKAKDYFNDELRFTAEQDGNTIKLDTDTPNIRGWSWRSHRSPRAWVIVAVPVKFDADIETSDGDLRVDHLDGDVAVRTADGNIELLAIEGPSVRVRTADGNIAVGTFHSKRVTIETADGDLEAKHIAGDDIDVSTADGDVELARVEGGTVSLHSADGNIMIAVSGKMLTASCADGDLDVELLSAMEVDIKTADGNISIQVPRTAGVDLSLRGDDVHIRGDLHVEGEVSNRRVEGSVNAGGPLLRAKTVDGAIRLSLQ